MKLGNIPSEVIQTKKYKCCMFSLFQGSSELLDENARSEVTSETGKAQQWEEEALQSCAEQDTVAVKGKITNQVGDLTGKHGRNTEGKGWNNN